MGDNIINPPESPRRKNRSMSFLKKSSKKDKDKDKEKISEELVNNIDTDIWNKQENTDESKIEIQKLEKQIIYYQELLKQGNVDTALKEKQKEVDKLKNKEKDWTDEKEQLLLRIENQREKEVTEEELQEVDQQVRKNEQQNSQILGLNKDIKTIIANSKKNQVEIKYLRSTINALDNEIIVLKSELQASQDKCKQMTLDKYDLMNTKDREINYLRKESTKFTARIEERNKAFIILQGQITIMANVQLEMSEELKDIRGGPFENVARSRSQQAPLRNRRGSKKKKKKSSSSSILLVEDEKNKKRSSSELTITDDSDSDAEVIIEQVSEEMQQQAQNILNYQEEDF